MVQAEQAIDHAFWLDPRNMRSPIFKGDRRHAATYSDAAFRSAVRVPQTRTNCHRIRPVSRL